MKPVFRLDQHPRRAQPLLSEPPPGYFEQLPRRVMARLPQAGTNSAAGWGWLLALPLAWRTSLASSVMLVGFAASFWLTAPQKPVGAAGVTTSLDTVSRLELVEYLLSSEARVEQTDLTEREMELLQLLSDGLKYKDIADRLYISIDTVKRHVHSIYTKLHVTSRTEAVNKIFPK